MFCPKCGKENPEPQRFCTSCGLRLETILSALTDESGTSQDSLTVRQLDKRAGLQDAQRRLGGLNPLIYGFILIAAGLLIGAIGYKVFSEKTLGDVGTLVALVGVLVIFLKGIFLVIPINSTAERSRDEHRHDEEFKPPSSDEAPALLSGEPPTITEHTTKQLERGRENPADTSRTTQPTLK